MDEEELAMRAAIKVEVEINEEPGEVNVKNGKEDFQDNPVRPIPELSWEISIEPIYEPAKGKNVSISKPPLDSQLDHRNIKFSDEPETIQTNQPLKPRRENSLKSPANGKSEKPLQEKPYKCPICQKAFPRKDSCARHVQSHSGIKRFECNICKLKYSAKGPLEYHLRTHSGEKPHKCDECGKCFTSRGNLSRHSMVHSGVKPFECDVCRKAFIQSGQLTKHMRSHTGERPYACPICNRSFTVKSSLSQHMLLHSGLRPFVCDICQKSFTQRGHLSRHKWLHLRKTDEPVAQNHFV